MLRIGRSRLLRVLVSWCISKIRQTVNTVSMRWLLVRCGTSDGPVPRHQFNVPVGRLRRVPRLNVQVMTKGEIGPRKEKRRELQREEEERRREVGGTALFLGSTHVLER